MPKSVRWVVIIIAGLFFIWVFTDSMGLFDNKSYYEIPHGSHSHYLPKDCDPPLEVGNGPTRPPGANEHIDCQGRIVPNEGR